MQIKYLSTITSSKPGKWVMTCVKVIVTLLSLYFIGTKLEQDIYDQVNWSQSLVLLVLAELILMTANWSLETLRWKLSLDFIEKISFKSAMVDVLSGLAVNWVLPFTSGDFLVRLASKKDKISTSAAVIFNRFIMLSLTVIVGIYSLFFLPGIPFESNFWIPALILIIITLAFRFLKKSSFLAYFKKMNRRHGLKIVGISILRYFIFFIQFLLLISYFIPNLPLEILIAGAGFTFLMKSAIPSLLGGIGLRESAAFFFFQFHSPNPELAIIPSFMIWFINVFVPSLVGLLMMWRLKVKIA